MEETPIDEDFAASLVGLTDEELRGRLVAVLAESSRRAAKKDWREWEEQNAKYRLGRLRP